MKRPRSTVGLTSLRQALDEVRFGPRRTLNLHEGLPTAHAAVTRAEAWLRQQQVDRAEEVLIITGRGNNSEGGVSPVRQSIMALLHVLERRRVTSGYTEHTPGSFVVALAPTSALWESPRPDRDREPPPPSPTPPSLEELDPESRVMLRNLAERSLEALGVKDTAAYLPGEMLAHFGAIAASIGTAPDRERRLRAAIRAALDRYE